MNAHTSWLRLGLVLIGLGTFFVSERYLPADDPSNGPMKIAGLAAILAAMVVTWLRAQKSLKAGYLEEAKQFLLMLPWKACLSFGLFSYMIYQMQLDDSGLPTTIVAKAALAAWLIFIITGFFALIGFELGLQRAGQGNNADFKKVLRSGISWTSIGLLLCSLVSLNFFATEEDKMIDMTYLKVTEPSDGTVAMLANLEEDLKVGMFFSDFSEVKPLASEYITSLQKKEPRLKVSFHDKELEPALAKERKITENGTIYLQYQDREERFKIGSDLNKARRNLKKLDQTFQQSLAKLIAKEKVLYFTEGHGEMRGAWDKDPRRRTQGLDKILRSQNVKIKKVGAKNGLLSEIPSDATAVVILAPTSPFLDAEAATIKRYIERGGSVLFATDDDDSNDQQLLAPTSYPLRNAFKESGLGLDATPLANEKNFVTLTKKPADRWFIHTNIFGSHEATTTLSKHDRQLQALFFRTGSLILNNQNDWQSTPLVKTLRGTFRDNNKNFTFDKDEKKEVFVLGAAATKKFGDQSARLIMVADAHVFGDFLLQNLGNQIMVLDFFKWLTRDAAMATSQSNEEDIKIIHNKSKHNYVFFGSILGVPALVLVTGFVATRRRKRRSV